MRNAIIEIERSYCLSVEHSFTLGIMRVYEEGGAVSDGGKVVSFNPLLVCSTLELPWKDNARNVSCIPEGTYQFAKRKIGSFYARYSKRLGHDFTIQVKGVPDRDYILVHIGNVLEDTRGCVLVGRRFRLGAVPLVDNSAETYRELYSILRNFDGGEFRILQTGPRAIGEGEEIEDRSFL